jgi:hypothetical protein
MGWRNVLIHLNAMDGGDSFGMNLPTSNAAELQNLHSGKNYLDLQNLK